MTLYRRKTTDEEVEIGARALSGIFYDPTNSINTRYMARAVLEAVRSSEAIVAINDMHIRILKDSNYEPVPEREE